MIHATTRWGKRDDKALVHVVTDELLHPDIQNNEYIRILKKIGIISLTNHVDGAICTVYDKVNARVFNTLARRLKADGYKYACFWFEGSVPRIEFEEEFLKWASNNVGWHAMGHIIRRPGRLPGFHEQVVILNLEELDDIDFGVTRTAAYPNFVQSREHVHDDYTPLWLQGTGGFSQFKDVHHHLNNIFDYFMYRCLDNGGKIVNVPEEVRDTKICVYPEEDIEHTLSWLTNSEFHARSYEEKSQYKFDHVDGDKWSLYEFLNMSNEILYITNTEDLPDADMCSQAKDTNVIICPASGLNQFLFSMPHLDTLEKIIWTDFNPMSIRWLQHVINEWDGYDFRKFFEDSKPLLLEWGLPDLDFLNYREEQVDELTELFNTPTVNQKFNKIKELEHVFLNIDIVTQYDQILSHTKDQNVFLQLSNIYSYEVNYIVNKHYTAQQAFYGLVNGLLARNKNVYFRGDTPEGIYYEMTNIGRLGSL